MSYVLGLDLGTSGLKGILVNREGKIVDEASSEIHSLRPSAVTVSKLQSGSELQKK
ncbi:MAG: hypothetical protein U5K84_10350 [Alkalibacterium sp.]|nr:hypothetical protein [Alkalibacterium sp.]